MSKKKEDGVFLNVENFLIRKWRKKLKWQMEKGEEKARRKLLDLRQGAKTELKYAMYGWRDKR